MCCFVSMKFCNQLLFTGEDGTVLITEFVLLAAFWLSFFSFFYVLCDQFERGTCGFCEARGLFSLVNGNHSKARGSWDGDANQKRNGCASICIVVVASTALSLFC